MLSSSFITVITTESSRIQVICAAKVSDKKNSDFRFTILNFLMPATVHVASPIASHYVHLQECYGTKFLKKNSLFLCNIIFCCIYYSTKLLFMKKFLILCLLPALLFACSAQKKTTKTAKSTR